MMSRNVDCITNEELELYAEKVKNDIKYGEEGVIIDEVLRKFPYNVDKSIVAMKISLLDLTNSTNLSRNLGTQGGLNKLAEKITKIDFDARVANGDISIVEELAKWTKKEFNKNLFSFVTKYCLYHNVHCYDKDDYVIYDSVVSNNLHKYITNEEYESITGKKLCKNSFSRLKEDYDYAGYKKIIDFIIEKNNITVEKVHRKLDWFIWYKNR